MFVPLVQCHKECGTIVFFTFKSQFTMMLCHKAFHQHQSKTASCLFRIDRIICTVEILEDMFLRLFRDTDAVVLHLYVYMTVIIPCADTYMSSIELIFHGVRQ